MKNHFYMHLPAEVDVRPAHINVRSGTTDSVIMTSYDTVLRHDYTSLKNHLLPAVERYRWQEHGNCIALDKITHVYVAGVRVAQVYSTGLASSTRVESVRSTGFRHGISTQLCFITARRCM